MLERNVPTGISALARTRTTSHRVRRAAVELFLSISSGESDDDYDADHDAGVVGITADERAEAQTIAEV